MWGSRPKQGGDSGAPSPEKENGSHSDRGVVVNEPPGANGGAVGPQNELADGNGGEIPPQEDVVDGVHKAVWT